MKIYKKAFAFVLVMISLFMVCTPATAMYTEEFHPASPPPFSNYSYMKEVTESMGYQDFNPENDTQYYDCVRYYDAEGEEISMEATPDYVLCYMCAGLKAMSSATVIIGEYRIRVASITSPDTLGYYIYDVNEGKAYTLSEAYDIGLNPTENALKLLGRRRGDVHKDTEINIKDVTAIQKYLAEIEGYTDVNYFAANFNKDGNVDIKDATAIQKYIAGLIDCFPVEE